MGCNEYFNVTFLFLKAFFGYLVKYNVKLKGFSKISMSNKSPNGSPFIGYGKTRKVIK